MTPYLCPVCQGRGFVPPGFYGSYGAIANRTDSDPCRACNSTGVLWGPGGLPIDAAKRWQEGPDKPRKPNGDSKP